MVECQPSKLNTRVRFPVGGMDSWPVGQLTAFFGGLIIVGAIVYAVCWRIGVDIYRKREL